MEGRLLLIGKDVSVLVFSVHHVKKQILSSNITGWLVGAVVGLGVELTAALSLQL